MASFISEDCGATRDVQKWQLIWPDSRRSLSPALEDEAEIGAAPVECVIPKCIQRH